MSSPLISVVVAIHGDAPWVEAAIYSVIQQRFRDWEMICVLDRVSPRVRQEVGRLSAGRKITVIESRTRLGAGRARNIGIRAARGVYVANLDSDDLWGSEHLSVVARYLQRRPDVQLVGSQFVLIDESGERLRRRRLSLPSGARAQLLVRNPFGHSTAVFRRDTAVDVGGYPEDVTIGEDYCLWIELALRGKVRLLWSVSASYRVHKNQTSTRVVDKLSSAAILSRRLRLGAAMSVPSLIVTAFHRVWLANQV